MRGCRRYKLPVGYIKMLQTLVIRKFNISPLCVYCQVNPGAMVVAGTRVHQPFPKVMPYTRLAGVWNLVFILVQNLVAAI